MASCLVKNHNCNVLVLTGEHDRNSSFDRFEEIIGSDVTINEIRHTGVNELGQLFGATVIICNILVFTVAYN